MSIKSIEPKKGLKRTITIPGDKSISHRSVMLGSIARGTTEVFNFLTGADCLATIKCFQKMGIDIEQNKNHILVHGKGLHGLSAPKSILDVGNSGTTTRLLAGILAGQNFPSVMSGDSSLNSRPMGRVITPLASMGANIKSTAGNDCAPLEIKPSKLTGIHYQSPVASAQVKSAVLLAGLYADGETSVTEPALSRNHTELMLQSFGVTATRIKHPDGSSGTHMLPAKELYGQRISVPGDISSAAYFIAAGLIVPNSELLIKNVGTNRTRAGFLKVCQNMGADITLLNQSFDGGEPTADLLVKTSNLTGTVIEGSLIPTLIDEIPIIAIMAAFAQGTTTIRNAAELKVKETNRIQTVTENLSKMGGNITPTEDGMIIEGGLGLRGSHITSQFDHRIAMAFAIAGLAATGTTTIRDSECVDVSYPEFWKTGIF